MFALICSNVMGATAGFDSGPAMILAFPRVYLVLMLWVFFLFALKPPKPAMTSQFMFASCSKLLIVMAAAFFQNKRWIGDVADGAVLVPLPSSSILHVQPRFEQGRGLHGGFRILYCFQRRVVERRLEGLYETRRFYCNRH